jgi:acyl-CoA synthetase (NDP forming)/RimJ/RimL family protein N-acetyltransferase
MPLDLARYVHDAAMRDGRTVRIRPIRPDDLDAMMQMWSRLSMDTIRLRFFAPRRMEREQMRHFTEVDYEDRFALVAARGERLIGVSRFDRLPYDPHAAEFAVLVEDAEQGNGVGTLLLRSLLAPAQDLGVRNFKGSFLRDNRRMREVLTAAGFEPVFTSVDGAVETSFRAVPSDTFLRSADERDGRAAVEALRAVLMPETIAVIGASRDPDKIGGMVFANLCRRYRGTVFAVNPHADEVQGEPAYPTVGDCPQVPDAVVVCVPPEAVVDVVTEAAQAGSRAAVVITAPSADDTDIQALDLPHVARSHGIRVVGPASMGVLNATDDVRMNATVSDAFPGSGGLAFLSQSGALGLALLARARALGLGLSSFVSVGAKSDISGNDLLQFWESDDATDVILLYLESFGNPQKFGRIARRVGRSRPIVAVKAGRSTASRQGATDHGSVYADDAAADALFAQAGVIRTRTLAELFDVAVVLSTQQLPAGRRIGIISNGRGPGTLAADACDAAGLEISELAPATRDRLAELLPLSTRVHNPVDISPSTPAPVYGDALRAVADDPTVDLVLSVFVPPIGTLSGDIAKEIAAARAAIDDATPMASVVMAVTDDVDDGARAGVPMFTFPEDAARALGHVAQYAEWRRRPLGHVVEVTDTDVDAARSIVEDALADRDDRHLGDRQTHELLATVGLTVSDEDAGRDGGVAMFVGVRHDPTFGSVLLVGIGGAVVDLLADVRIRLHPVTDHDVDDMLAELRGFPLLVGDTGAAPVDLDALRNVLFRVNALVEAVDEIEELDLQPVVAMPDGIHVGGGRIRLARHGHRL